MIIKRFDEYVEAFVSNGMLNEGYLEDNMKMSEEDKRLLLKYDRMYGEVLSEYRRENSHFSKVKNSKSEIENYINAMDNGLPYTIKLEYEDNKFSDDSWCDGMIKKLEKLKNKFITIDCYLKKFYVHEIDDVIESIIFLNRYSHDNTSFPKTVKRPSYKLYKKALEYLDEYKYRDIYKLADEDSDYKRTFTPEESRKRLQKVIDDHGYGWKVIVDKNMIPRMAVQPYGEFRINANNNFSEVDLQSLEVHEIEVHTARKHNALKTGLYLFLYGLDGYSIYDEGMAIYNSMHKTKKQKPNIMFFVAIKIVILYHLHRKEFDELYRFLLAVTGAPKSVVVFALIRAMRIAAYNSIEAKSPDATYLDGYEKVKDMTQEMRDDLLQYEIGPDQLYELPTIKEFFKVNKFEPLKTENIKNEYENTHA